MHRLIQKLLHHPYFVTLVMALSAFVLAVLLGLTDAFQVLELKSYDVRFSLRGAEDKPADNIVVVAIDDQSFSSIPYRFPYPRSLFARAIENLAEAGARLIVVDIEFTEPDHFSPQEDARLAEAIRRAGNVILAGKIVTEMGQNISSNTYLLKPLDQLMEAGADWALVNTVEDVDGFTRRYILYIPLRNQQFYPLSVKAYMRLSGISSQIEISDGMARLDLLRIPRIANTMLINYRGPAGTFRTYSFANVIDDAEFDLGPEEDTNIFEDHKQWGTFRDKIVFIGASAEELQDNKFTPFFSMGGVRRKMPGVEVHANALSTLLRGDFIKPMDRRITLLYMLLFAVLITLLGIRAKPWKASVVLALLVAAYIGAVYMAFVKFQLWVEVVQPLAAIVLSYVGSVAYRVALERREKGRVKRVFQQYVAPSVVENLLAKGEMPKFGGERRELTVLFSDIRSFTSYCERHDAESVVYTLNEYLTAMVEIIFRHKGTLDKFVGDEIMALFGAPLYYEDHAVQACETACEMITNLRELQKKWSKNARDYFHIGIGINTGTMIVGNLGSQQLFDYTVIGDEVNLAARLEGANKQYWTSIIISESTYRKVQHRARVRELDLVRVKGKKKPVKIYELRSMEPLPDIEENLLIGVYEQGLAYYKQRRWYDAMKEFKRVLRYFPSDGPSRVYIKRCLDFIENPPPENWDGVYEFKSK